MNFDLPIHPILVHFPIALSFIIPLLLLIILIGQKKGFWTPKALIIPLVLQIIIIGSGYVAMEFGEKDEEKVEHSGVAEQYIEEHEEAAEVFLYAQAASLAICAASFVMSQTRLLQPLALLGSLLVLIPTIQVGHSGGQLVYKHGAAKAFTSSSTGLPSTSTNEDAEKDEDRD